MSTEDIIVHIFYLVDKGLKGDRRVPQTHLYLGEIVTIGILFAIKDGHSDTQKSGLSNTEIMQ